MLRNPYRFHRPLCYKSRARCPILQCLRTTSVILPGAHSYFVLSSFKCINDENNVRIFLRQIYYKDILVPMRSAGSFICYKLKPLAILLCYLQLLQMKATEVRWLKAKFPANNGLADSP